MRLLQLRMCISTVNSPTAAFQNNLFAEPPLDDADCQNRSANSDIEHPIFVYINAGF